MTTDALQKSSINNAPIEYVKTTINLRFTFNQTLTWDAILRILYLTKDFLLTKIKKTIAKMYLISVLLYGLEVFSNWSSVGQRKPLV